MPGYVTDGQTFLNPLGLAFTLVMGVLLLGLPRRYAIIPILALICYMTMGTRVIVGGLNFTMLRILLIFGWFRLIARSELRGLAFNQIDKALIWWTIVSVLAYGILWNGEYDAFKYKLGKAYDCLGFYFLFRFLVKDGEDALRFLSLAAVMTIPLAAEMILERLTLVNQFAIFGGVAPSVWVRDATPRCQGPFSHPILAGTFGASLVPLFVGLWAHKGRRIVALFGISAAIVITVTAGSSGPIMAFIFGMVALCLWPARRHMRGLRWAIAALLIALHLAMKAPVWFLMARLSVYNASTGFHRAFLIDRAIANFGEWWLLGTKTTNHWGHHLFDVTNHYVRVAVDGGILSLALFIAVIAYCFRAVGALVHAGQTQGRGDTQRIAWATGAALVVHSVSYLSVSYFDQNLIMWFQLLAMISSLWSASLTSDLKATKPMAALRDPEGRSDVFFASSQSLCVGLSVRSGSGSQSGEQFPLTTGRL